MDFFEILKAVLFEKVQKNFENLLTTDSTLWYNIQCRLASGFLSASVAA